MSNAYWILIRVLLNALFIYFLFGIRKPTEVDSIMSEDRARVGAARGIRISHAFAAIGAVLLGFHLAGKESFVSIGELFAIAFGYMSGVAWVRIRAARSGIPDLLSGPAKAYPNERAIFADMKESFLYGPYTCSIPPLPVWMNIGIIVLLQGLGLVIGVVSKQLGIW